MKQFKAIGSLLLGVLALYVLVQYVPQAEPYLNAWTVYLIFLCAALLFIFCTTKHKPFRTVGRASTTRREYILSGTGERTNEEFLPRKHTNYTLIERSNDGAIYSDDTGILICTQYVEELSLSLANPFFLLGECLALAMGGLFCCKLYELIRYPVLPLGILVNRISYHAKSLLPMLLRTLSRLDVLAVAAERTFDGLKKSNLPICFFRIWANLDFSGVWAAISKNFVVAYHKFQELIRNV